ncbi:MAG: radical SAM protein [Candidatus Coatesbacteria bacterium]|nr:radical SAM protein [Candidatus Coatesbacteria bacterium]
MVEKKDFIPPVLFKIKKRIESAIHFRKKMHDKTLMERACHFHELFPNHDGDIFPCCLTWGRRNMKIANLRDKDLLKKIADFDAKCYCERYRLRKARRNESPDYDLFNIEFSLLCNGNCAMCGVRAPYLKKPYEYYKEMKDLIILYKPRRLSIQGGEIFIQKKTVKWLEEIRKLFPSMEIGLLTNGNHDMSYVDKTEELFNDVWISFVGYQSETYKKTMGLEIERSKLFAMELIKRRRIHVTLKFLTTASNIHEANLFLKWGIEVSPQRISFQDSDLKAYINNKVSDNYWKKIFHRTADSFKSEIRENSSLIAARDIKIFIDSSCREILEIDDEFLDEFKDFMEWFKN